MTYTIKQLADEFGLTHRALRFYDAKGLLTPQKDGWNRLYSENDRLCLGEIVRGIRYGLTLKEIAGMIEEGPTGPWLHVPAKRAAELVEELVVEHTRVTTSIYDLKRIASGEPVGAFSGQAATSGAAGAEKRTPASLRKGGGGMRNPPADGFGRNIPEPVSEEVQRAYDAWGSGMIRKGKSPTADSKEAFEAGFVIAKALYPKIVGVDYGTEDSFTAAICGACGQVQRVDKWPASCTRCNKPFPTGITV